MHAPARTHQYQDIADFNVGIGEFDRELINDPDHPKRYRHLYAAASHSAPVLLPSTNLDNNDNIRDAGLLGLAFVLVMFAYLHYGEKGDLPLILPTSNQLAIRLAPPIPQPESPPPVEKEIVTPPVPAVEQQTIESETNKETESDRAVNSVEPETQDSNDRVINLREQIPEVVQGLEPLTTMPPQQGLSAPGVIVDRRLRDRFNSAEIAELNRWRAPENFHSANPGGRGLSKIGALCFLSSQAAQGGPAVELPLVGNGWNLNYYREVDCNDYFKAPRLDRRDIRD